jgi:hypothetical protein
MGSIDEFVSLLANRELVGKAELAMRIRPRAPIAEISMSSKSYALLCS